MIRPKGSSNKFRQAHFRVFLGANFGQTGIRFIKALSALRGASKRPIDCFCVALASASGGAQLTLTNRIADADVHAETLANHRRLMQVNRNSKGSP
jgi:deoxyhypusine synthase